MERWLLFRRAFREGGARHPELVPELAQFPLVPLDSLLLPVDDVAQFLDRPLMMHEAAFQVGDALFHLLLLFPRARQRTQESQPTTTRLTKRMDNLTRETCTVNSYTSTGR